MQANFIKNDKLKLIIMCYFPVHKSVIMDILHSNIEKKILSLGNQFSKNQELSLKKT